MKRTGTAISLVCGKAEENADLDDNEEKAWDSGSISSGSEWVRNEVMTNSVDLVTDSPNDFKHHSILDF